MSTAVEFQGLSAEAVRQNRQLYGANVIEAAEDRVFLRILKGVFLEPMFILLMAACAVYFFAGQYQEGIFMLAALVIVSGISIFQEYRSEHAVKALRKMAASKANVIRDGIRMAIDAEDLVKDDLLQIEEGEIIAADGMILTANDLSLNESILTGESFPVHKSAEHHAKVYKGTLVSSGSALIKVTEIGMQTQFGKIGLAMKEVVPVKTPLQIQVKNFVRIMLLIGAGAFLIVIIKNYLITGNPFISLLQGLTLAMSIIPEEVLVALSTFQALGAYRLLRHRIIVKHPQHVETLGAATVVCADKTGTITQNRMELTWVYDAATRTSVKATDINALPHSLIEYAMWASEVKPFDPMERSIHQLYERITTMDERAVYRQVHEYPMGGIPPMMTHIFSDSKGEAKIAVKGAPEAILRQTTLSLADLKHFEEQAIAYAREGLRVLGIGKASVAGKKWPASQQDFTFDFLGLLAFQDPPKENIVDTISAFHKAGIAVKMVTGDYPETALAISRQVGLEANGQIMNGKEVLHCSDQELQQKVKHTVIFARMFPEAKLKVIDALKRNGEIVAMTGDGVNDGPALKAAHIGIAMGDRGSEVARAAASLILIDDDFTHLPDAVAQGRKIYDNLKKAIRYIISIHVPIILIVLLPLLLGWHFRDVFFPVHVIFLELIMGPTCSIVFENEPMEPDTMLRKPRPFERTFLSWRQLLWSIIQGVVITAGCLGLGVYADHTGSDADTVRTLIFMTLLFSNLLLTFIDRSFTRSAFSTLKNKNRMLYITVLTTLTFSLLLQFAPYFSTLFHLAPLSVFQWGICLFVSFVATFWFDIFKRFTTVL
jgi:Ca2+-transporting ATPase